MMDPELVRAIEGESWIKAANSGNHTYNPLGLSNDHRGGGEGA